MNCIVHACMYNMVFTSLYAVLKYIVQYYLHVQCGPMHEHVNVLLDHHVVYIKQQRVFNVQCTLVILERRTTIS